MPVGMFMMSLILIVVVFALPDKSGVGRSTKHRHRSRPGRDFGIGTLFCPEGTMTKGPIEIIEV
jgi:hypothetical protein